MEQDELNKLKIEPNEIIRAIPALIIGISSVCFILGLIIENIHLAQYGINSSEFIRTEYILSGAVYLFLITFAYIADNLLQKIIRLSLVSKKISNKILKYSLTGLMALLSIFGFAGMLIAILIFITLGRLHINSPDMWASVLIIYISGISLSELLNRILNKSEILRTRMIDRSHLVKVNEIAYQKSLGESYKGSVLYLYILSILMAILFLILSATIYGRVTYKYIHVSFGGGNKDSVIFFPTYRGLAICKALALPISKNNMTVGPLEVLYESEKELIIHQPVGGNANNVAIRINKSMIEAIQTIPSEYLYSNGLSNNKNLSNFIKEQLSE